MTGLGEMIRQITSPGRQTDAGASGPSVNK